MRTLATAVVLVLALTLVVSFAPHRQLSEKDSAVAGRLWLDPVVPRVGASVKLRALLFNLDGLPNLPLPYESPRGGDTVFGILRPTGNSGEYVGNLVYTEPGRRWINIYLEGPEGRLALTTGFWVFNANDFPEQPVPESLAIVVRPAPAAETGLSLWLKPVTYIAMFGLISTEIIVIFWCLVLARRHQTPLT